MLFSSTAMISPLSCRDMRRGGAELSRGRPHPLREPEPGAVRVAALEPEEPPTGELRDCLVRLPGRDPAPGRGEADAERRRRPGLDRPAKRDESEEAFPRRRDRLRRSVGVDDKRERL